jgi:hypothetical protein
MFVNEERHLFRKTGLEMFCFVGTEAVWGRCGQAASGGGQFGKGKMFVGRVWAGDAQSVNGSASRVARKRGAGKRPCPMWKWLWLGHVP